MSSDDDDSRPGPSNRIKQPRKRVADEEPTLKDYIIANKKSLMTTPLTSMVEVSEPAEEEVVIEKDDMNRTHIKPEMRSRAQDVEPTLLNVVAKMYKKGESTIVALPALLEVMPTVSNNDPDDYRNFDGRLSSWFIVAGKKPRIEPRTAPTKVLKHKCNQCPWSFNMLSALQRHYDTHVDHGVYACMACLTLFNYSVNMYEHWRYNCRPTVHDCTVPAEQIPVSKLRSAVFGGICSKSHANMFNVFDGAIFIPSEMFLNSPNNIIMSHHNRMCHLCSLDVPTKFLECHGDVHRGRFRIDKPIFGFYYCHLCSMVFKLQKNLILHWRTKCREVVAHSPDEYCLDDEEVVALAFLVLQQSVPHDKISRMMEFSKYYLKKFKLKHANENNLLYLMARSYYYFPQEIWPMKTNTGYDVLADAFHLDESLSFAELAGRVHNCNLLATACPDFYATGMEFNTIRVEQEDPSAPQALLRVVLRFTTEGSVMSSYKVNGRSIPRLRPRYTFEDMNSKSFNTDIENKKCAICKEEKLAIFANNFRLEKHMKGPRHKTALDPVINNCPVCNDLLVIHNREEHWQFECVAIETFVEPQDREFVDEKLVEELKEKMEAQDVHPRFKDADDTEQNKAKSRRRKQTVPRELNMLYEKIPIEITGSEAAIQKVKENIESHVRRAEERAQRRRETLKTAKEPNNEKKITVCPHCAGKYDSGAMAYHLERRHGYDRGDEDLALDKVLEKWRKNGRQNTLKVFRYLGAKIVKKNKPVPPLMTSDQYENTNNFMLCNDSSTVFDSSPWSKKDTIRNFKPKGRLFLLSRKPDQVMDKVAVANRIDDLEPFYPKVTGDTSGVVDDTKRWLPVVINDGLPRHPRTGKLLPDPIAKVIIDMNRRFFDGNHEEMLKLGFNVNTTHFFSYDGGESDDDEGELEISDSDDEGVVGGYDCSDEDEFEIHGNDVNEEDEAGSGDEDDGEDRVGRNRNGSGGESDADESPEEERVELVNEVKRKEKLEAAMKKWKTDSTTERTPLKYDKNRFSAMPQVILPQKDKELKHLTRVLPMKKTKKVVVKSKCLALNLSVEKHMNNMRSTFRVYRDLYQEAHPSEPINQNYIPVTLINKSKFVILDHKDVRKSDDPEVVVDDCGAAFVGGIVFPTEFSVHNLSYFYLKVPTPPNKSEEMAIRMRIYNAMDKFGKFKFAWPAQNSEYLTTQFSRKEVAKNQSNIDFCLPLNRVPVTKYKLPEHRRLVYQGAEGEIVPEMELDSYFEKVNSSREEETMEPTSSDHTR